MPDGISPGIVWLNPILVISQVQLFCDPDAVTSGADCVRVVSYAVAPPSVRPVLVQPAVGVMVAVDGLTVIWPLVQLLSAGWLYVYVRVPFDQVAPLPPVAASDNDQFVEGAVLTMRSFWLAMPSVAVEV